MTTIAYEAVLDVEQISRRTLQTRIARGDYRSIPTGQRHPNGRATLGIPLSDLTSEAQERYWTQVATGQSARAERPQEGRRESETETSGLTAPSRCLIGTPVSGRSSTLHSTSDSPPAREGYIVIERPDYLPGHIPTTPDGVPDVAAMRVMGLGHQVDEWDRRMRAVARVRTLLDRADHGAQCAAWTRVAAEYEVGVRTLRRWDRTLQQYGACGLVPAWGQDRRRSRMIPDDLGHQILDAYLDNRQWTIAMVWRHIVVPYYDGRRGVPHVSTVRRYIDRHVTPLMEVTFRTGEKAYRALIQPKIRRNLPPVNSIWCADHRLLDVMVLDGDHAVRPWVTSIIDVGSAAWVGYRLCRHPNSDTVAGALRSALLTYGLPTAFLRDNGKEFVSRRMGGKPARLQRPTDSDLADRTRWPAAMTANIETSSIWTRLGIQLVTALPYRAWSKPIEPTFGAYSSLYERLVPGWTGRDAKEKPAKLAGEIKGRRLLTWQQFAEEIFPQLIAHWNTAHCCGERTKPPLAHYEGYERHVPDAQTLSFLLQQRQALRVRTTGLHVGGHRYMSERLALYIGITVQVAWDPGDPTWITAYTPDDQVLAVREAPQAEWMAWGEANELSARAGRVQRHELARVRDQVKGAAPVESIDPTGAYRLVAGRLAEEQRSNREAERQALVLPEADHAAAEQTAARAEAVETAATPRERSRAYKIRVDYDAMIAAIDHGD